MHGVNASAHAASMAPSGSLRLSAMEVTYLNGGKAGTIEAISTPQQTYQCSTVLHKGEKIHYRTNRESEDITKLTLRSRLVQGVGGVTLSGEPRPNREPRPKPVTLSEARLTWVRGG